MHLLLRFVLIIAVGALLLRAQDYAFAQAEQGPLKRLPPGVVVSFEGGVAGDNISAALREIARNADGVPAEEYIVQPRDSLCGILAARNFPPPCRGLAQFVDSLNPKTQPFVRGIKPGDLLMLPKLQMESYDAVENFYSPSHVPKGIQALNDRVQNLRDLNAELIERAPGQHSVRYNGFRIFVPTKDDETADKIFDALSPLISRNLFVDVLHSKSRPRKPNSLSSQPAEKIKELCLKNGFGSDTYRYADLVDADPEAKSVVEAHRPKTIETISVVLIDTPMKPAPNLYPAYDGTVATNAIPWTCRWVDFKSGLHHSTHLASIIASQQDRFGFVGLAKNVRLDPFVWVRPAADDDSRLEPSQDDIALGDKFRECGVCPPPLRVFLAAVDFGRFVKHKSASEILSNAEQFKNFGTIGNVIKTVRPLLVVAAGQPDEEAENVGLEIGKKSNMSPQAFGDLGNVIVVTACEECSRKNVRLMSRANSGRLGDYTVHVAAPGGKSLPGWVSEDSIGAASGTSQAAAYVAGVVASMIGAFPGSYTSPAIVKSRIQVTSRPFPPENGDVSSEASKLTAGVVDPVLALLDPRRHWFKDSVGWHEAASWSPAKLTLTRMDGGQFEIKGSSLLRLVRVQDVDGGAKRWTVYEDMMRSKREKEPVEPGTVGCSDLVSLSTDATLTSCDGPIIPLSEVDDFIPSIGEAKGNGCGANFAGKQDAVLRNSNTAVTDPN
jgi:Subtilase family